MTRRIMEFELSRDQIQSMYIFFVHKGLSIVREDIVSRELRMC